MIRRNMGCRCRKQAKTLNKLGWCFTLSVSGLFVSEGNTTINNSLSSEWTASGKYMERALVNRNRTGFEHWITWFETVLEVDELGRTSIIFHTSFPTSMKLTSRKQNTNQIWPSRVQALRDFRWMGPGRKIQIRLHWFVFECLRPIVFSFVTRLARALIF